MVAVIDVPVLRLLQWRLGRSFETYEGVTALPYLGSSASMPGVVGPPRLDRACLATANPAKHDIVFGGHGLAGSVAPPDWDAVDELVGGSRGGAASQASRNRRHGAAPPTPA